MKTDLKDGCFSPIILCCSKTRMGKGENWVFPGLKFCWEIEQEERNKAIEVLQKSDHKGEWTGYMRRGRKDRVNIILSWTYVLEQLCHVKGFIIIYKVVTIFANNSS